MAAMFNEFVDLAKLGFPGWETSPAKRINGVLVRSIRAKGCLLETFVRDTNSEGLWDRTCEAILRMIRRNWIAE